MISTQTAFHRQHFLVRFAQEPRHFIRQKEFVLRDKVSFHVPMLSRGNASDGIHERENIWRPDVTFWEDGPGQAYGDGASFSVCCTRLASTLRGGSSKARSESPNPSTLAAAER